MPNRYLVPLLVFLLVAPAMAQIDSVQASQYKPIILAKSGMSLEQATAKVKRQTGGRILSASESRKGGRKVYRIKVLLPSGNVRVVTVNAN